MAEPLTHRELDALLESHRKGSMLFGSDEHDAFVEDAIRYIPRLVAAARSAAEGEVLLEVRIPGLVPPSPNTTRREHWANRSRRVKHEKEQVRLALLAKRGDFGPAIKLPLIVTVTRCSTRLLDADNCVASGKAAIDAVAEWLGVDDADPRVTWRVEQRMVKRDAIGTVIRIVSGWEREAGGNSR